MAYSNGARVELLRESAELEERLKPITAEMNGHPLRVNTLTWVVNRESAEESAHFLIDFCRYLADDDWFRPNSTADCGKALFTNRGLKPSRLSKKSGRPLTDKDTLAELANSGDNLAPVIIDARSAITRWGQLKAWRPYAEEGFVQTKWDSLGCPHGRYTSDGPCLNNRIVPIRDTIEADDGYSFLSLDLSQCEYATWASLSGDLNLSRYFREGRDFHSEMAHDVMEMVPGWDLHGQDPRQCGKTLNFAILYKMQVHTLARKLGCSTEVADRIQKAYFGRAETGVRYIERVLEKAKRDGFVETFFGRRRYCPELQNGISEREQHEIEKTCWNHVCAGSAAELLKWKQVKGWELLRKLDYTADHVRLVIQNYDECIWMVRNDVLVDVQLALESVWATKERGFLPLGFGVKSGRTWGDCSK
jgi:DNA polymerase-1